MTGRLEGAFEQPHQEILRYDRLYSMRPIAAALASLLALFLCACPSNEPELFTEPGGEAAQAQAEPAEFLSKVHMADPRATVQLLQGFHALEQGAWRWTERSFSVALKSPPGAAGQQVHLELKFSIADASIERLGPLTLTASIDGTSLGSKTYEGPGDYTFSKPVRAGLLAAETVRADFKLDKALPPSDSDHRELGVIAVSVALQ